MFTPESFSISQSQLSSFAFISELSALKDHFHYCSEEHFTGQLKLKFQSTQVRPWSLYFEKGKLVWGEGGVHPLRRWYRQLAQYCEDAAAIDKMENPVWPGKYESWMTLLLQNRIQPQAGERIVAGLLTEILVDLHQQWWQRQYNMNLQLKFDYVELSQPMMPVAVAADYVWLQARHEWHAWQDAGLADYCPNDVLCIVDADSLQQRVLPSTYQNLMAAVAGKQTLRDLAMRSRKDLLTVAKSLSPYIQAGWVKLLAIEDVQPHYLGGAQPLSAVPAVHQVEAPLIAYIDDQVADGQTMERILTQMGYRSLHIQDPIQALPLLLEHKPEFIFLDLVMPIVNGYEACAQIRRMSRFKDTPIIILTSNDGIVDRVRAKIVGSTGFLAKPIQPAKVQTVLQKYLQRPSSIHPVANTAAHEVANA